MRAELLLITLVLIAFFGCASANVSNAQTPAATAASSETATGDDRALAAQWEKTLPTAPETARENVNHAREPWSRALLEMLAGKRPGTAANFAEARTYYKRQLETIELARVFPPPPKFTIVRADKPVNLDGKAGDPAWQKIQPITISSTFNNPSPVVNPAPASAKLLWDEQYLYVLFVVQDNNIMVTATKHDDPVSQGTCVELFMLPSRRWGQYWEINAAPTGVVFDSFFTKYEDRWGSVPRVEENLQGMKIHTNINRASSDEKSPATGYTVEIAVPWSELPGMSRPVVGDKIYLVLGQAVKVDKDPTKPPKYFCHAPILAWFHNIRGYSEFTLEK